jgi:hypothetical protein
LLTGAAAPADQVEYHALPRGSQRAALHK